ncbi:zinc finger MYM-type protein 1-like, partial [Aphis craccivora]
SFSKLKIIKNYLRNSLSQIKLSGLALIAIENEIVDSLNLENIVDTFAAKKARKKIF